LRGTKLGEIILAVSFCLMLVLPVVAFAGIATAADTEDTLILGYNEDTSDFAALEDVEPTGDSYKLYSHWGGVWYDAEKTADNNDDDWMCWAATASNILQWTGWGLVADMENSDEMFEHFQDHWTDLGSLMEFGWHWWFDGTVISPGPTWSDVDVAGGGNFWPTYNFADYYHRQATDSQALAAIDDYLHHGYGVGLGIYRIVGGITNGHAITCWGYNYDPIDPTDYIGLWITDSDDDKAHLSTDPPPDRLRYYEVEFDNTENRWYLQDFYGTDTWWIGEVQALEPFPLRPLIPIDLILVLDRSGSMAETMGTQTKMEGAKDSAIAVIDSLMPTDRVSVVSFSDYGTVDVHLTGDFNLARQEVENIETGGLTSFGAGLSLAVEELTTMGSPDHAWAIIFMSNGYHNTEPLPDPYVEDCQDLGIPIYTVGLGSTSGNVNEPLLIWMAEQTGGEYHFAPSLYELQTIFLRFSLEVTGWTPIEEFTGTVFEGETVLAGTFDVAPLTDWVRITLNWPGSDLDIVLVRPDGTEVDYLVDEDAIYSGASVKPEWVFLDHPEAGTWEVHVYGKVINSPDEPYIAWVSNYIPPTPHDTEPPLITVITPDDGDAVQDGITLKVSVVDMSGVDWVTFSIREPNGDLGTIIDDDFESLPAVYTSEDEWELYFDTTELPDGYYILLVEASDSFENSGYETVEFSIRNWACVELLPATETNRAGRTMPVKFSLRIDSAIDPCNPFVVNEELTIEIYEMTGSGNVLCQTSVYGDTSKDYRIDSTSEHYITNFKTMKKPATYLVEIWRKGMLLGFFEFSTTRE
jgi:hypothetical protein